MSFAIPAGVSLVSALSYHMFRTFWRIMETLSDSNKQAHKNALLSLLAQALTCSVMLLPIFGFFIDVYFGYHNQKLLFYHELVFSCHSSTNCIVMIITVKEYRNFVKSLIYSNVVKTEAAKNSYRHQI
ncbi:unnamed protein product [Caenorhabditis angaria]|uniref:G-protein coupled receptors family 1 profile domain-containing protein n=1 Tax=Caenorhabditis angaria TaxID=860376 RepID=A0A9P1MX53_9PELO|nr:unnamed protein product [Caenorhabditis angaria]